MRRSLSTIWVLCSVIRLWRRLNKFSFIHNSWIFSCFRIWAKSCMRIWNKLRIRQLLLNVSCVSIVCQLMFWSKNIGWINSRFFMGWLCLWLDFFENLYLMFLFLKSLDVSFNFKNILHKAIDRIIVFFIYFIFSSSP